MFAYVTVGGLNQIKVFRTEDFSQVATISVGKLPHGIWPSGDGTRVYVGLENDDRLIAIDTLSNRVIASVPIGQAPQAVAYVPNAVPEGTGTKGLERLGVSGQVACFAMRSVSEQGTTASDPTSVTLFDQGLVQVVQASITGLEPKRPYVLALATRADGSGTLQALATFTTNPAGAAIVNAVGPIRQLVEGESTAARRYLVIAASSAAAPVEPVQIQSRDINSNVRACKESHCE